MKIKNYKEEKKKLEQIYKKEVKAVLIKMLLKDHYPNFFFIRFKNKKKNTFWSRLKIVIVFIFF